MRGAARAMRTPLVLAAARVWSSGEEVAICTHREDRQRGGCEQGGRHTHKDAVQAASGAMEARARASGARSNARTAEPVRGTRVLTCSRGGQEGHRAHERRHFVGLDASPFPSLPRTGGTSREAVVIHPNREHPRPERAWTANVM